MVYRIEFVIAMMIISIGLGGCVSMGKYELKEKEVVDSAKALQDLQVKYDGLEKENADVREMAEKQSSDLTALASEKKSLEADNAKLKEILEAKSDELSSEINELRQKAGSLESDRERLKEEIASLQKAKTDEVQKTSRTYEEMLEKMKSEISQGQVTISELKGKLTVNMVDAVLFDSGKAEVKQAGLVVLQKVIDILKTVDDKSIRIEGHTDNVQISDSLSRRYPTNWELSAARAVNVARYLQQQGINPAMLSAVAYGEYRPVANNDSDEGRAKNRRIEIILVPGDAP